MPEVILHLSKIRTLAGQGVAVGMPEHAGPDSAELGPFAGKPDDEVDSLSGYRLAALESDVVWGTWRMS